MSNLTQPQEVFQVFHYLDKTLSKMQHDPRMDLDADLHDWGYFFAPAVQKYLQTDVRAKLQSLQNQLNCCDLTGMIDYSLLSMRMIVEENETAHDAITDQLDHIWYNRMNEHSINIHETTIGPILSQLCAIVYDERKQRSTLSF